MCMATVSLLRDSAVHSAAPTVQLRTGSVNIMTTRYNAELQVFIVEIFPRYRQACGASHSEETGV